MVYRNSFVKLEKQVQELLEDKAASKGIIEKECKLKSQVKTTFIMTFSSDGRRMASLHGDHTIRITDVSTGHNIQTLVGHPRSPWTVEFHKFYPNLLASGCLGGEVRIWDLFSGDCDVWQSPSQSSITSIALHPTEKILLIAEANNVYTWHWEMFLEPQLFASSRKQCEKVRWVKFDNSGDIFYTGITTNTEYDSWNILRLAPSAFEMNQQRRLMDTAARSRGQYQASLSATVSLGEMLGNPLEISNDLLAQPNSQNDNVDVYHVATTFAQLHRIHTGDSEDSDSSQAQSANLSMSNYISSGRSPRVSSTRENEEGRFNTTQTWSPSRQRQGIFSPAVSNNQGSILEQLTLSSRNNSSQSSGSRPPVSRGEENRTSSVMESQATVATESQATDTSSQGTRSSPQIINATPRTTDVTSQATGVTTQTTDITSQPTNATPQTTGITSRVTIATNQTTSTTNQTNHNPSQTTVGTPHASAIMSQMNSGASSSTSRSSGASAIDDTVFGVSLRAGLSSSRPVAVSQARARNLATSRPPIRRFSNSIADFEPNRAVEAAQQAEQAHLRVWSDVLKILGRLEGVRGPRLYSSNIVGIARRLEELVSEYHRSQQLDTQQLRLLRLLRINILQALSRSALSGQAPPQHIKGQLVEVARRLQSIGGENVVATTDQSNDITGTAATETNNLPAAATSIAQVVAASSSVTDSSTNTEPRTTRSFGVSTDDYVPRPPDNGSSREISFVFVPPDMNSRNRGTWVRANEFYGEEAAPQRQGLRHAEPGLVVENDTQHSSVFCSQRVQRWRLDDQVPHLCIRENTIINRCKIHNDASIDISQDGKVLAVLVKNPNTARCPGIYQGRMPDTMLRLVSLVEESLGAILYQITLVANPASLSISPLCGYIVIGLAGYRSNTEHSMIKYDVYKIPEDKGGRLKMARSVYTTRPDNPMAIVNCVRWLPFPGQGIVIGTNQGNVIVNHATGATRANLNLSAAEDVHLDVTRNPYFQQ